MAAIRLTMRSSCLRNTTDVNVIYPLKRVQTAGFGDLEGKAPRYESPQGPYKVLWLVHGGGDNYSDWSRRTRISEYAEERGLFVVMPTIRDFTGSREDVDYYGFLSQELPGYLRRLFPISCRREDNFIAGLSMGGYFSYRIALNNPDRYSCVGSLSSPLDIVEDLRVRHSGSKTLVPAETLLGTDRDLHTLVERNLAQSRPMPRMFQACGTEDFTYGINCSMRDFFREKGLDHTWMEGPGIHNWVFWERYIQELVAWLPLDAQPESRHRFQKEGN